MIFMVKFILTISVIVISLGAKAQDEKMVTDRRFTIVPGTVPEKWMQVETGFYRETEKLGMDVKDHFMLNPVLSVKYGVVKRLEIRLIAHYYFNHLLTIFNDTLDGGDFRFAMQHTVSKTILSRYNIGMEWEHFKY